MVRTPIFSRYCMTSVIEIFFSNGFCEVDYQKLLNYHTSESRILSSIYSQSFTIDCLMSQKTDLLKSLLDVPRNMNKNQYLMLLKCIFYNKIRVLVCSIHCRLYFTPLVIKLLLINLKIKLNLF